MPVFLSTCFPVFYLFPYLPISQSTYFPTYLFPCLPISQSTYLHTRRHQHWLNDDARRPVHIGRLEVTPVFFTCILDKENQHNFCQVQALRIGCRLAERLLIFAAIDKAFDFKGIQAVMMADQQVNFAIASRKLLNRSAIDVIPIEYGDRTR